MTWSPGTEEDQQPHRNKVDGINGKLLVLKFIVDHYKITTETIEIACNNMEAKNQFEKDDEYVHISQNCADIIQDIQRRKSDFPTGIKFKWR